MLELNVILICIEAFFLLYRYKSERNRKIFIIITCIQVIILSGLRHIQVGMDTYNYMNMFERTKLYSWKYLWDKLIDVKNYSDDVEPGFYISMKLFQIFSNSFRTYLIVFACFVNIPLFVMIYKRSKEPFISVLLYVAQYFSFFSTTGLRQTMAVVFMAFLGLNCILKRNFIVFIILFLVSYTCHRSSLVFLPFYFIAYKKPTVKYFICCIVGIVVLFILRSQFTNLLATMGGYEEYSDQYEGAGTINFSIISIMILAISMWKYNKLMEIDKYSPVYINACIISCMLLPITFIDPSNLRAVFYYSIFTMILIPDVIHCFEGKDRTIVMAAIIILLLFMYFKNDHIYRFFWQPGIYDNLPSPV